jgi:hypothetical protein
MAPRTSKSFGLTKRRVLSGGGGVSRFQLPRESLVRTSGSENQHAKDLAGHTTAYGYTPFERRRGSRR